MESRAAGSNPRWSPTDERNGQVLSTRYPVKMGRRPKRLSFTQEATEEQRATAWFSAELAERRLHGGERMQGGLRAFWSVQSADARRH